MKIYIPTIGREEQKTFNRLPKYWQKKVVFVAYGSLGMHLKVLYENRCKAVLMQPSHIKGIAQVRQWILEKNDGKILMLDDDLKFAHREKDGLKLHDATPKEIDRGLWKVDELLDIYAHGSISTREGNNRVDAITTFIGRPLRALAYNCAMVKDTDARFDRIPLMEDFDMTLQLLREGLQNFTIWNLCHDQAGSNAEGGCSTYRTAALQTLSAKKLAKLHPGFVKVVQKETKSGWFGGVRTDVRIAWKKAYESAR